MSNVSPPDWIISAARSEAAKLNLPVAVIRSFSAHSRKWAAELRQRLTDLGVDVIDAKPPQGHGDLPQLAAIVIAPRTPTGPAWKEAAYQDIPVITPDDNEQPPTFVECTVTSPLTADRRHITAGEVQLIPDSSGSRLGVTVDHRSLGSSPAAALTIWRADASLILRFRPAWHIEPDSRFQNQITTTTTELTCNAGAYSLQLNNTHIDTITLGARLKLQTLTPRHLAHHVV